MANRGGGIGSDYASSGGTGPSAQYAESQPVQTAAQPAQAAQTTTPASTQPAASTPAAAKAGGLGPIAKSALTALPGLALAGYQMSRGPQNQAQEQALEAQAAQDQALYEQQLSLYNAGQIPPGEDLQIKDWLQAQENKINQEFDAMDRFQSTDRLKAIQNAQDTATTQFNADLQQELNTANLASSQAAQDLATAAQIQAANDRAYSNALISALGGIGKVGATALISTV